MSFNISNRVTWETHLDQQYILFDYSNLNDREVFNVLMLSDEVMKKVVDRKVKMLIDLRNMDVSYNTYLTVAQVSADGKDKIKKAAFVNNRDSNKIFINDYLKNNGLENVTFEDRKSALEYLMNDQI